MVRFPGLVRFLKKEKELRTRGRNGKGKDERRKEENAESKGRIVQKY